MILTSVPFTILKHTIHYSSAASAFRFGIGVKSIHRDRLQPVRDRVRQQFVFFAILVSDAGRPGRDGRKA